jgi:hypothetical protein
MGVVPSGMLKWPFASTPAISPFSSAWDAAALQPRHVAIDTVMCVGSVLQRYVRLECERERSIPFVATGFSNRKVLESCLGSAQ